MRYPIPVRLTSTTREDGRPWSPRLVSIAIVTLGLLLPLVVPAPASAQLVDDPVLTCRGFPVTHMGTQQDDVLIGTDGPDVFLGGRGDDTIIGLGGSDVICAGHGNDRVRGGPGNDTIDGGRGHDHIDGGPGGDRITGSFGDDIIDGGEGADQLRGGAGRRDAIVASETPAVLEDQCYAEIGHASCAGFTFTAGPPVLAASGTGPTMRRVRVDQITSTTAKLSLAASTCTNIRVVATAPGQSDAAFSGADYPAVTTPGVDCVTAHVVHLGTTTAPLASGTDYDLRVTVVDADGDEATQTVSFTTRAMPVAGVLATAGSYGDRLELGLPERAGWLVEATATGPAATERYCFVDASELSYRDDHPCTFETTTGGSTATFDRWRTAAGGDFRRCGWIAAIDADDNRSAPSDLLCIDPDAGVGPRAIDEITVEQPIAFDQDAQTAEFTIRWTYPDAVDPGKWVVEIPGFDGPGGRVVLDGTERSAVLTGPVLGTGESAVITGRSRGTDQTETSASVGLGYTPPVAPVTDIAVSHFDNSTRGPGFRIDWNHDAEWLTAFWVCDADLLPLRDCYSPTIDDAPTVAAARTPNDIGWFTNADPTEPPASSYVAAFADTRPGLAGDYELNLAVLAVYVAPSSEFPVFSDPTFVKVTSDH